MKEVIAEIDSAISRLESVKHSLLVEAEEAASAKTPLFRRGDVVRVVSPTFALAPGSHFVVNVVLDYGRKIGIYGHSSLYEASFFKYVGHVDLA